MLSKEELTALKNKMPRIYVDSVISAYKKATGQSVSRRTVFAFFAGTTYSIELHNATLSVAEMNRQAISTLRKRTSDILKNN